MKNKLFTIILMIIIIMGLINITVSAANYKMHLSSNIIGKNITVTLSVANFGDGIDAIQGTLKYDTDKIEFIEMKRESSKWQEPSYSSATNKFTMLVNGESFKENSNIIVMNFKLKENVVGKININLSDIILVDTNDQKIDIPNVSTYVNIESNLPNDDKNEISNTITNEVISNITDNDTSSNIISNTIKDNTQANNKIPQTGENNTIIYIGVTLCSFIILSSGIHFIRYKILSR